MGLLQHGHDTRPILLKRVVLNDQNQSIIHSNITTHWDFVFHHCYWKSDDQIKMAFCETFFFIFVLGKKEYLTVQQWKCTSQQFFTWLCCKIYSHKLTKNLQVSQWTHSSACPVLTCFHSSPKNRGCLHAKWTSNICLNFSTLTSRLLISEI